MAGVQWDLNNGHSSSGDRPPVHCREVFPFADVMPCMLQLAGGKQFVFSTDVVCFSECPLSEVPLYSFHILKYRGIQDVQKMSPTHF